jgi:hypothetical protein
VLLAWGRESFGALAYARALALTRDGAAVRAAAALGLSLFSSVFYYVMHSY